MAIKLDAIRRVVEDYMVDTCTIVRTTAGDLDRDTGQYSINSETIYSGPCMVAAMGAPTTRDRASQQQSEAQFEIGIRYDAPKILALDSVVITSAAWDPESVGDGFLVLGAYGGTYLTHRRLSCRNSAPAVVGTATNQSVGDVLGGPNITDRLLKEWTAAGAYQVLVTSRDPDTGQVATATVIWPDGSEGVYTADAVNPTTGFVDGYTISHELSSKAVVQPTITRDIIGQPTNKPPLEVH